MFAPARFVKQGNSFF